MATPMKKAPVKENAEKPEAEETATNTVELKGENVSVKRDYVDFGEISKSKLALINVGGVDVKKAHPDWHFSWFTEEDAVDFEYLGWEKVHKVFGDDVKAKAQPQRDREDSGCVRYKDLLAYCVPLDRYNDYLDWVQREQVIETDAMFDQTSTGAFRSGGHEFANAEVTGEYREE